MFLGGVLRRVYPHPQTREAIAAVAALPRNDWLSGKAIASSARKTLPPCRKTLSLCNDVQLEGLDS